MKIKILLKESDHESFLKKKTNLLLSRGSFPSLQNVQKSLEKVLKWPSFLAAILFLLFLPNFSKLGKSNNLFQHSLS